MAHSLQLSALALATLVVACGESTSSRQGDQFGQPSTPPSTSFDQNQMLESMTDNVILPTFSEFANLTQTLDNSIGSYCSALSGSYADALAQAQTDWQATMTVWQMAELMQIGPLLENDGSLRNKIYSWPNVSTCAVDQDIVLAEQPGYDVAARTSTRKGLDALEYLLFNNNLDHTCTVFGTEPEGWNSRTEDDRRIARCEFAQLLSEDLNANASELLAAWQGTNGYAAILKNAGSAGSPFADVHEAVNDVSDSLFYTDKQTKDAKLATPVGLFANDCGLSPCAQNTESQFAFHSFENIAANLEALLQLYMGGEDGDIGFKDYLLDVGDSETAERMQAEIEEALAMTKAMDRNLKQLLEDDPEQVEQLHAEIKDVTDIMKNDFIQSLALELPATSAGDND
ncbi:imelysin family protein [Echinimonas agarilytica]|uniref:Imelysin family protein n=1 Tax=Echinimonas agarilytica TaxID=1215918 RepID=A0AA41W3P5_9GAMM|nr:imelysin family protein [Echinimonas agarilytica]MCM2678110.1 imelysin family protein [Echinimonas agarilytica]